MENGDAVNGLAAGVSGSKLRTETNPLTLEIVEIDGATIKKVTSSEVSPMSPGLIYTLSREQISICWLI